MDTFKDTLFNEQRELNTVLKYMLNRKNNIYITDTSTTIIANKGGIDKSAYNPRLLKQFKKRI